MSHALILARKELRDILRERTIVVALVVQLFVAGFSTLLSVGLLGLYDPSSVRAQVRMDVAYSGEGGFDAVLQDAGNLRLQRMPASLAVAAFQAGTIDAAIEENMTEGVHVVTILVPDGEIRATLLVTQLQGALERHERHLREAGQERLQSTVRTFEAPVTRTTFPFAFLYGTLLPLLVVTPVFLSGAIAGDSFQHEVQTRTLGLLRSAPIRLRSLLAGKLLTPVLLAPAQVMLWVLLMAWNGAPVRNLPILLALTAALATLVASVGLAITCSVKRPGQSQASYAVAALGLAVGSLLLPRSPMNLIAAIATDLLDPATWQSLAILAACTIAAAWAGIGYAAQRIRRDQV